MATRRRGRRAPIVQEAAEDLRIGDVIYWDHQRAVVIEESDGVKSAPHREAFNGTPAWACVEPRIAFLTDAGNVSHRATYIVVPRERMFMILERREEMREEVDQAGESPA